MQTLLHFAEDSDTSGYFPQLARWHDRSKYRMVFGTLKPMAPWLRDYMLSQGVPCFSCESRTRKHYPLGFLKLVSYLRRHKIQILHTHLFDPSVVGLTAGFVAGTPLRVTTRHYSDYHTRINKRWHVKLDQWCNRLSHAIIGVSKHTSEHLISVEKANPEKVTTILNGIDFDRVRRSSSDSMKQIRATYLSDDAERLVLMVGRLHPEKGYEHLFAALPHLSRMVPNPFKVLIAGTGPLMDRYKQLVESSGLDSRVIFLGYRKDIADLMSAADIMVLPSVAEAFGLVLAEALYLGTPVVATNIGGIPEIISDGVDGILVPPANPEALAMGMAKLLNDVELRERMAGTGVEKVQKQFHFQKMVSCYERVYQDYSPDIIQNTVHA